MSRGQQRRLWTKRFKNFIRSYSRSKLGLLGLAIMLVFVVMALLAPLLTPYDPVFDYNLASGSLPPTWLNQLQGKPFSPFISTPAHHDFISADNLAEWTTHASAASNNSITVSWNASQGVFDPTRPTLNRTGSMEIAFNRPNPGPTFNATVIKLSTAFDWPAGAALPSAFDVPYNLKATLGTQVGFSVAFYIQTPGADPSGICRTQSLNFTASPCATLYNSSYIWNQTINSRHSPSQDYAGARFANNLTLDPNFSDWQYAARATDVDSTLPPVKYWFGAHSIGSVSNVNPSKELFQKSGSYAFVIQVAFYDRNGTTPASGSLLIANTYLQVKGNTWGILGLDEFGHDIWSQLLYGARISLIIGTVAALVAVTLGLLVGVVAGYFGGAADQALMRITDVLLTIPFLPLVLVLTIMLAQTQGRSYTTLIIALGVLGWAGIARIIRAQVLSVKALTYVESARAIGASDTHILARHIIPNVSPLIWVNLALAVPGAIVTEAAVSFLGFGDPTHVSWGIILYNAQRAGDYTLWWRFVPAGIAIALVSLSFLLVGYSLDEILNPKLRAR